MNLKQKPDWLLGLAPMGKVPVLQIDDKVVEGRAGTGLEEEWGGVKVVTESLVCNEWLDEVFPGPKLLPADATDKALQKMLVERVFFMGPVYGWSPLPFPPLLGWT